MKTTCPPAEIQAIANPVNSFYVYTYMDPRKPGRFSYETISFLYEPFYVGKGHNKRYLDHLKYSERKRKSYFRDKLLKILSEFSKEDIENYILILRNNLTEQEAFDLEKQLVEEIGRYNLGVGPLTNLTNGGEGTSGHIVSEERKKQIAKANASRKFSIETRTKISKALTGIVRSKETRKKMSNANMGKKLSEQTRQKLSGRLRSEEARRRMSEAGIGRKRAEETRKKISQARMGFKFSEETRRKISEAAKKREARKRGRAI